jgi:tryptophan 2-monooxygenase
MRLPFFSSPESHNCVLDYYRKAFKLQTQPFPNPGSGVCDTGILYDKEWKLWPKDRLLPPDPYNAILRRWLSFKRRLRAAAAMYYNKSDAEWRTFWFTLAAHYQGLAFHQLVTAGFHQDAARNAQGDFGGLGLDGDLDDRFRVVGAGDGGWGAFYGAEALWLIRTLVCGFGDNLQLITERLARATATGIEPPPASGFGKKLTPQYLGVQSLAECLFFEPATEDGISLDDATREPEWDVELLLKCMVDAIEYVPSSSSVQSSLNVHWNSKRKNKEFRQGSGVYDAVILTPPGWQVHDELTFSGFEKGGQDLPGCVAALCRSLDKSHWIRSVKIFFPLRENSWQDRGIPQVLVTNARTRDSYGYAVGREPGVLLASYTWEEQADRVDPHRVDPHECLAELDEKIGPHVGLAKKGFSGFIGKNLDPVVIPWQDESGYKGCAKIGKPSSWKDEYALLVFNQEHSKDTRPYLAGEAASVEGGWVEPALRSALDAVIHLVKNTGGEFQKGFDLERHYPKYSLEQPKPGGLVIRDLEQVLDLRTGADYLDQLENLDECVVPVADSFSDWLACLWKFTGKTPVN